MSVYAQIKFKGGYNMDLKHIEELAKDKDLIYALISSYFMDYDVDAFDWDFENSPKPKYYKDLTDSEKIKLIHKAYDCWRDIEEATLGIVCDVTMGYQSDILNLNLSTQELSRLVCNAL